MHGVKNILVLGFNFDADFFALRLKGGLQVDEADFRFVGFGEKNHVKKAVQNILADTKYVDIVIGEDFCHRRDNSDAILADNSHNQFHLNHLCNNIPQVKNFVDNHVSDYWQEVRDKGQDSFL